MDYTLEVFFGYPLFYGRDLLLISRAFAGAVVIICLVPLRLLADPFDLIGAGSRVSALAGGGTALIDGPAAAFYNPAALTVRDDFVLGAAYSGMVSHIHARVTDYGTLGNIGWFQKTDLKGNVDPAATRSAINNAMAKTTKGSDLSGLTMMASLPLRRLIPALDREITLGAVVFMTANQVHGVTPNDPDFAWLGSRLHRLMVVFSAGVELWPKHISLGAGVIVLADISGNVHSMAPVATFDPAHPDNPIPPPVSVSTFSERLKIDVTPIVGLLIRATHWLSIGLSYRGQMNLDLNFNVDAGVTFNVGGKNIVASIPYHLRSNLLYLPHEFTLGLAAFPLKWLTITADFTVAFTKNFGSLLPVTRFTIDPSVIGPNGELLPLKDLGNFRAQEDSPLHVRTRNTYIPKIGFEFHPIAPLTLSMGYSWHPSPLMPDQAYQDMLLDSNVHLLGLGVGIDIKDPKGILRRPFNISAYFNTMILDPRYNHIGRVDTKGNPIGRGVVKSSGYSMGGGLSVKVRF